MTVDRGLRANHDYLFVFCGSRCPLSPRLDNSNHGNMRGLCDLLQRQGCCRIAGDNQHLDALILEEMRRFNSIPGYSFDRFRAVGEACGVPEIMKISLGENLK